MRIWIAILGLVLPQISAAAGGEDYGGEIITKASPERIAYCQTMDEWVRPDNATRDPNGPLMFIRVNQGNTDETVDVFVKYNGDYISRQTYDTSTGTGIPGYDDNGNPTETVTYEGKFGVTFMNRDHRSGQFGKKGADGKVDREHGAPMYNAIFFNGGEALHGTLTSNNKYLGQPASHGCVRLKREQSAELFQKVCEIGPQNVLIQVVGTVDSSQSIESSPESISPAAAKAIKEYGGGGLY